MPLVERVVHKALEPLLLSMSEDPEGWDRAHAGRGESPPPAMGPYQLPHHYPLPCGCYLSRPRPTCRESVHRAQAEAEAVRNADERKRQEREAIPPMLMATLETAVPLWIDRLRPMTWEQRMQRRDVCLSALCTGEQGDSLDAVARLVCGEMGGGVAEAFNALAEGLALGALQPGGVTFAGVHFEAQA